jgi:hypothetical protein
MQLAYETPAKLQLTQLQRLLMLRWPWLGLISVVEEVVEQGEFSGTGACGRCQFLGRSWRCDVRSWRRRGEEASEKEKYEPDPCWSCGAYLGLIAASFDSRNRTRVCQARAACSVRIYRQASSDVTNRSFLCALSRI